MSTLHIPWDGIAPDDASITTVFDAVITGREVLRVEAGDMARDPLRDLVLISLFTWRRATADDPVPEGASRQGWWADPTMGSRLWLLQRAKLTTKMLGTARQYAEEALAWLVREGIASAVSVTVERHGRAGLAIAVSIARPRDPRSRVRYDLIWGA